MNNLVRNLSASFIQATNGGSPSAAGHGSAPTLANGTYALGLEVPGFSPWSRSSSPAGIYPPGGFTNFIQLNGGNANNAAKTPLGTSNVKDKEFFNVDDNDDESPLDHRIEKRLNWTKDEDIRLASAWLRNSKDPVEGNDRKAEQFWLAVTKEYNNNTESCRQWNRNQLKIRWDRVKKPVGEYHGCWIKTIRVYRSGFSDDQLMDMTDKMYSTTHKDKDFRKGIRVVRDERKWSASAQQMLQEGDKGSTRKPVEVLNLEYNPNIRPTGHKKATAERNGTNLPSGKMKTRGAYSVISDKLDKFIEVSTKSREDREKMSEKQQALANSKVEAARLNKEAAEKTTQVQDAGHL